MAALAAAKAKDDDGGGDDADGGGTITVGGTIVGLASRLGRRSWAGFALATPLLRADAVLAAAERDALDAMLRAARASRRFAVALRMAAGLPPLTAAARRSDGAAALALALLAECCRDPVCCEEVGWLGGHQFFLREIMSGSEAAEAAVTACSSCAALVAFPTAPKPGLAVDADERRPALTFSFRAPPPAGDGQAAADDDSTVHLVLQEIPTTAADIAASDRTNMTVGYHMWDAGTALSEWIVQQRPGSFDGKVVLELGAGLGLPGIVAAAVATPAEVWLTDFNPKVVANLEHNVQINLGADGERVAACCYGPVPPARAPVCAQLDWERLGEGEEAGAAAASEMLPPRGSVDLVLGSDIICQDSDCAGICRALRHFMRRDGGRAVFVCGGTKNRYGIDKFPGACAAAGLALTVAPVPDGVLAGVRRNLTHNSRPHDELLLFEVSWGGTTDA